MGNKFSVFTEFKGKNKLTPVFKSMTKSAKSFGVKVGNVAAFAGGRFKKLGRSLTKFKTLLLGVAFGVATKQIVGYIDKTGKLGDILAKTARAIDIESSSLQKLQFVAQRQGVSTVTLNKGLEKLNRNIGELKLGTGTLNTMLKRANPALIGQLNAVKSTEEAFDLLLTAIDKAPTTFMKTVLSVAAFGRTGVELLRVTKGGSRNILELKNRFLELGGVVSDKALRLTEKYMDATLDMSIATRGLRFAIAEQLLPELTPLIKKFAEWIADNKVLIALKIEDVVGKVATAAGKVKEAFDSITPETWRVINKTLGTTWFLLQNIVGLLVKTNTKTLGLIKNVSPLAQVSSITSTVRAASAFLSNDPIAKSFWDSVRTILVKGAQNKLSLANIRAQQASIDVTVKADQGTSAIVKSSQSSNAINLKNKGSGIQ